MLKKYPEPASAAGRASSFEVLGRVADRADALGITPSLEVVNRYESNLFNTVAAADGRVTFNDLGGGSPIIQSEVS